ncbi:MAG TPA: hypothetical protein VJL59_08490 [Anaerolineales bacterium]|nr:hypothetical protein [Anaerolineales bacterium]
MAAAKMAAVGAAQLSAYRARTYHLRARLRNEKERRVQRKYMGRAHTEKSSDLIVARRQKHQGMHWSEDTSDARAALHTLLLNGGWDLYWQKHQVLPLAVPIGT